GLAAAGRKQAFMPRKSIYNERHSHANCRRWPRRAVFALRGCLWEFEGAEARCQSNRGIKSGADVRESGGKGSCRRF
ncbi:hypothetical protein CHH94_21635, partial [Bacillus licheniformis]